MKEKDKLCIKLECEYKGLESHLRGHCLKAKVITGPVPESFKIGDIVEAYGVRGKVVSISDGFRQPVKVQFYEKVYNLSNDKLPTELLSNIDFFSSNGKSATWHIEPSLKLIERPVKMVETKLYAYQDTFGVFNSTTPSKVWWQKDLIDLESPYAVGVSKAKSYYSRREDLDLTVNLPEETK